MKSARSSSTSTSARNDPVHVDHDPVHVDGHVLPELVPGETERRQADPVAGEVGDPPRRRPPRRTRTGRNPARRSSGSILGPPCIVLSPCPPQSVSAPAPPAISSSPLMLASRFAASSPLILSSPSDPITISTASIVCRPAPGSCLTEPYCYTGCRPGIGHRLRAGSFVDAVRAIASAQHVITRIPEQLVGAGPAKTARCPALRDSGCRLLAGGACARCTT